MGRQSGIGGLIAILGLVYLFGSRKKLTAGSFFTGGYFPRAGYDVYIPAGAVAPNGNGISYSQYVEFATDIESKDAQWAESTTTAGLKGKWRTVNGRIPTPQGGSIPLPSLPSGSRVAVDKMLQPFEEQKGSEQPKDVYDPRAGKMRIDVSSRLRPI